MTTPTALGTALDVEQVFDLAANRLERLVAQHPGRIPVHTEGGRWKIADDAWAPSWTGGFLAGQMWILAESRGDQIWRDRAEQYSELIEDRRFDTGTHDLGFLFTPSWGRWHRLAPSARSTDVLVQAARSLASNFNPQGRYLRTWVDAGSTFIDIMMNVDLLFEAGELAADAELVRIATEHADTSRRFLVRGDATTAHEGWFDPETGEFLRTATHQGYRADSSWVRGHAWALYGFTSCFLRTGNSAYLTTAEALAHTYLEHHAGSEPVTPNDWQDPHPDSRFEASGASIMAAGLLQLAGVDAVSAEGRQTYADAGTGLLSRLSEPPFLATDDENWDGLIRQATYHRRNGLGVQESNMWGDYYFLEAVETYAQLRNLR